MNPLTDAGNATVTSGTGTVSGTILSGKANEIIVFLSGVAEVQTITVAVPNVSDAQGNSSASVIGRMAI